MTVQELRNNGYKVKVLHHRLYNGRHKWQVRASDVIIGPQKITGGSYGPIDPDTKGGSTHIIIDSPNGDHFEGIALCSKTDNYDKKLGVRIALGRSGVYNAITNV